MSADLQPHLDAIDRSISEAAPGQVPAIIATLSAKIGAAAARMMQVTAESKDMCVGADENLSTTEAARRLGVSPAFLYKNASRLPFTVRIGRRVLFSSSGLERWNRQRQGR